MSFIYLCCPDGLDLGDHHQQVAVEHYLDVAPFSDLVYLVSSLVSGLVFGLVVWSCLCLVSGRVHFVLSLVTAFHFVLPLVLFLVTTFHFVLSLVLSFVTTLVLFLVTAFHFVLPLVLSFVLSLVTTFHFVLS